MSMIPLHGGVEEAASVVMKREPSKEQICDIIEELYPDKSMTFRARVLDHCEKMIVMYTSICRYALLDLLKGVKK
jgi:hypothetical protein